MKVKLGQQFNGNLERFRLLSDLTRKDAQNTLNLLSLLDLQFAHTVIEFDNHHRLNKHRCAAGRLIVNNTAHVAATIRFYRNNVTIIANRDDRLLQSVTELVDQRP